MAKISKILNIILLYEIVRKLFLILKNKHAGMDFSDMINLIYDTQFSTFHIIEIYISLSMTIAVGFYNNFQKRGGGISP